MQVDAVQIVRDAFSALNMNTEVIQEQDEEHYCVVVITMDGHDILQLTVEDMRDGTEPEPTYERKKFQTLTQAVEETVALPEIRHHLDYLRGKPPGATSPGYLDK